MTLQETRLPDKETVREIVTRFRSFYKNGISPDDVIGGVALESKANAYIEQLSGGQQQRLAVALSLVVPWTSPKHCKNWLSYKRRIPDLTNWNGLKRASSRKSPLWKQTFSL